MFRLFPESEARQDTAAGVLSGGEQQMLTMCRTLMGDPDLILIDEPTEGLAPKLVEQVGELLAEIAQPRRLDPAGRTETGYRAEDFGAGSTSWATAGSFSREHRPISARMPAVRREWLEV